MSEAASKFSVPVASPCFEGTVLQGFYDLAEVQDISRYLYVEPLWYA